MESLKRAFRKLYERDTAPRNERFLQSTLESLAEQRDEQRRASNACQVEGHDEILSSYFEKQATRAGDVADPEKTSTWPIVEEAPSSEHGKLGACVHEDVDVDMDPALQVSTDRRDSYANRHELATSRPASATLATGLDQETAKNDVGIALYGDYSEDFTYDDPNMVLATDGTGKACPAILPNLELITAILEAAKGSRMLVKQQKRHKQNEEKLRRLKAEVNNRIRVTEVQRKNLEDQARHEASNAVEPQPPTLGGVEEVPDVSLGRQIDEVTERLAGLEDARSRMDRLLKVRDLKINNAFRTQRDLELCVHAMLDTVLVKSNLLEPEDEDDPYIDPMEDTCSDIEALIADQPCMDAARKDQPTNVDELERGGAQEEKRYAEELFQELREAGCMVSDAQFHFDNREAYYEEDLRNYLANIADGIQMMPREEFDLHHLQEGQRFTRQLIEAEEWYADVEKRIKEAGITRDTDEDSCMLPYDRDMESCEGDVAQHEPADWSGIERWVDSVAAQVSSEEMSVEVEVDDWEARLPVQMSDSVSCIAEGDERKYIDDWRNEAFLAWEHQQAG